MQTAENLTPASSELFNRVADDAPNWGGNPYLAGNIGLTKPERGNLTQLKRAGLILTHDDPESQGGGGEYVSFTEAGHKLAHERGYTIGDGND